MTRYVLMWLLKGDNLQLVIVESQIEDQLEDVCLKGRYSSTIVSSERVRRGRKPHCSSIVTLMFRRDPPSKAI